MNQMTLNSTEVKVEEINGKTILNIQTTDADVFINGVCIWSKYDKEEYSQVPPVLRSFIHGRNDFLKVMEDNVVTDLWLKDTTTCVTLYIPINSQKGIIARIDSFTSMEELEFEYLRNLTTIDDETAEELVNEFKGMFNEIEKTVQWAGYKLVYSHASGDLLHGWWDVKFKLEEWNEKAFILIWEKFARFNARLNEVLDKY